MQKSEIFDNYVREITEYELFIRRNNCDEKEKQLYADVSRLSEQTKMVLSKLALEDQEILNKYKIKTNMIADHECHYLYVQGIKDCVNILKILGVL